MKAAVILEHGGPGCIAIDNDFSAPTPGPGDVVVKVGATSLNYHDIFTRRGMPGINVPMPCIMGLDFAGEISEIGGDVTDWKVGQRVLVDPVDRVGPGGLIGEMWHGGLAEFCSVPAHHLVALPDNVSFEQAACLPVAYGTAHRMMYTVGDVQKDDKVLILGASGGVGTCAVLLAKARGCEVIVCASTDEKLKRLAELGADHGINYTQEEFHKWVWNAFGKPHRRQWDKGVDVVVNFTGGDTWVPSLKVVHRGGKILTCGATAGYDPAEDLRYIWSFELKVLGSNGWMREDLETLIAMISSGDLDPVVDSVLPLEDVNEAFRLLEDREVFGKVVVKI
ncbi:MAG: zinc-binding dehydrogenase [Rhodospirillaceae bacterium]|nr:zinc-binding dehydrogenase [Rhodospirillaceae bacterium]MBT5300414.1 zinc-binding dehydrogenase [Rhodospirillaceae bacterium]MBT6085707.1 zinc-binding dehydrogenase [Rhodospirillaceae bacterium]